MRSQRRFGHTARLAACWLLSLAACSAPPAVPTPAPTLAPTLAVAQGTNSKLFDIGGRRLFLLCEGTGSPTVILEAGHGNSVVDWQHVMPELSAQTRVCAYDRAGLGFSDPPAIRPMTSRDTALDLHNLLKVAGEAGPYVLVGHSYGGIHVRVYAGQYPDEVVGVVLLDASHPDQVQAFLDILPPAAADDPEEWQTFRTDIESFLNDPSITSGAMDVAASNAQARASGDLGDKPLVVVTAHEELDPRASEIQADLNARIYAAWLLLQADLVGLSTEGTHLFATRGGHMVQLDEPELVVEAIKGVVQAARK